MRAQPPPQPQSQSLGLLVLAPQFGRHLELQCPLSHLLLLLLLLVVLAPPGWQRTEQYQGQSPACHPVLLQYNGSLSAKHHQVDLPMLSSILWIFWWIFIIFSSAVTQTLFSSFTLSVINYFKVKLGGVTSHLTSHTDMVLAISYFLTFSIETKKRYYDIWRTTWKKKERSLFTLFVSATKTLLSIGNDASAISLFQYLFLLFLMKYRDKSI